MVRNILTGQVPGLLLAVVHTVENSRMAPPLLAATSAILHRSALEEGRRPQLLLKAVVDEHRPLDVPEVATPARRLGRYQHSLVLADVSKLVYMGRSSAPSSLPAGWTYSGVPLRRSLALVMIPVWPSPPKTAKNRSGFGCPSRLAYLLSLHG
ncbi:hypothetical protein HPP92_023978 [Vanilla planifolia]|uniref:Uncharacterized protein n=1 Tax=Vanilla planifolia TaxID=51239 RepID=A0A835PIV0_VANPL|nr:hypothetical protein HPP92_023978 [Vanilla planifolia]